MQWLLFPVKWLARWIHGWSFGAQRRLGRILGWLWFDVLRIRRQVILDNLAIAFPEMPLTARIELGRRAMHSFGLNLVEYSHLPFLAKETLESFEFHGLDNVQAAFAKGKGVLLLTLHMGNGDLAAAAMALKGFPIHLVSKVFKTKWLNEAWFGMRERVGVRFIPPRNSSFGILKALKKNDMVIFVLDQFTGPPIGIKTRFFGRETGTGLGLAMMAERSGAAVVPAYCLRHNDGRLHIYFEPEIPFVSGADRDQSLAHMTQVYTDRLEHYVRMCPEQWMWLHKRWKRFKH